jgi:hypothetical protein
MRINQSINHSNSKRYDEYELKSASSTNDRELFCVASKTVLARTPGKVDLADQPGCILKVKLPDSEDELTILIRESDFKKEGIRDNYLLLRQKNISELMQIIRDEPIAEIVD